MTLSQIQNETYAIQEILKSLLFCCRASSQTCFILSFFYIAHFIYFLSFFLFSCSFSVFLIASVFFHLFIFHFISVFETKENKNYVAED